MKRPFMLLYVNDLLASPKVSAMDDEQFAWYLRMLMRAWVNEPACLLPNLDAELMQAAGCKSAKKWAAKKELVLSCWVECDGGKYLTQTRLQLELAKAIKISDKRSEAGKQSGVQRKLTLVEQKGTSVQQKAATQTQTQTQTQKEPRANSIASRPEATQQEVFIDLPLNDNTEFQISHLAVANYAKLYPAVDVPQEFRGMKAWLMSNREKRKTRTGVLRFANAWLAKVQNNSGSNGNGTKAQSNQDATRASIAAGINKRLADLGGAGDGLRKGLLRSEPSIDGSDG